MMHGASTGSGSLMIQVPPPERLRVAFYTFQLVARRRH